MPSSAVGIRLPPSCSHGVLGGIAWTKWLMMLTGESPTSSFFREGKTYL